MAQFVEIDIDQGTDFNLDLALKEDDGTPKNLQGYTFFSAIKKSYYSTTTVATFSINNTQAGAGNIILSISSATTSKLKAGRYVFDIKQRDTNNNVERLVEGILTVNPQITI